MSFRLYKTSVRYNYKKVRNFLGRTQSKELLTFLFFLCLSFMFWILQSVNEEGEDTFTLPVKINNIPEQVVFTTDPPSSITLKVRGKGVVLLNHKLGNVFQPLEIDFSQYKNQSGVVKIKEDQLLQMLKKQMRAGLSIVSISPDTLNLMFSSQKAKIVPVHFNGALSANSQMLIGKNLKFSPDSVKVYAPKQILDTIRSVRTEYIRLANLEDTLEIKCMIKPVYGAKIVPPQVRLTIPVEEYTEKTISIPITVTGLPDSLTVRTFPSNVNVSFFVALSMFKDIRPGQFEVSVSYSDILNSVTSNVHVELIRSPENISNINITPSIVDFILEEKDVEKSPQNHNGN